MKKHDVSFSWRNYTKPTPANLEAIATSLRRLVAIVAGTTVVMEAEWWIPFTVLIIGAVLDEIKNFFAKVAKDSFEQVTVEYPSEIADQVTVKTETKEDNL